MNHLRLLALLALCALPLRAQARTPDPNCSKGWPLNMAVVQLKNATLLDPTQLDESKTTSVRVASEPRPHGLFHQVYKIHLAARTGQSFDLLVVADASREECSMGEATVYLIARKLP